MTALALDGLKVVDLAWVVAGPMVGRVLADCGAEVVRVESAKRIDTARMMGPFPGGTRDPSRSALFENCNAGKLGLSLDLSLPQAREVVLDLVAWGDVLVESFASGQMARWGLAPQALLARNPRLIILSTSLMGQTGPLATLAGFGNVGAAMSGFQALVGYPDGGTIGPFGPYTDYVSPRFATAALLAALARRKQTGVGGWLDVAQVEAGLQFLAPEFCAYFAHGTVTKANGNRTTDMAPHGVFRCAGHDAWVAIAVRSDAEWARLAVLLGLPAQEAGLAALAGRKDAEDAVERMVSEWTASRGAQAVEQQLQGLRIPAHVVASSADMADDPQLAHLSHFVRMPHPAGGESVVEASRFRLSATPAAPRRLAPTLGRDNDHVLRAVLGYDDARIAALHNAGILV